MTNIRKTIESIDNLANQEFYRCIDTFFLTIHTNKNQINLEKYLRTHSEFGHLEYAKDSVIYLRCNHEQLMNLKKAYLCLERYPIFKSVAELTPDAPGPIPVLHGGLSVPLRN
jgi:hypothetical protein